MFPSLPIPDEYKKLSELYVPPQSTFLPQKSRSPYEGLDLIVDDWQKQQEELASRQRQRSQRLARMNSMTDAFRLLTQAVGGTAGATIPAEQPNQSVIGAYNEYRDMDREKRDRIDRFKALELQNLARGIQHDIEQQNIAQEREFRSGEAEKQRTWRAGQEQEGREFEREMFGEKTGAEQDIIQERGKQQRLTEQKKADLGSWYYNQDRGTSSSRRGFEIGGVVFDEGMKLRAMDAIKQKYAGEDYTDMPRDVRTMIRDQELPGMLLMQEWDYLRSVIPEMRQAPERNQLVLNSSGTSGIDPSLKGDGNPAVGDKVLLQHRLSNIMSRSGRPDKPNKKLKDDRRPRAPVEKQAEQKDRVGYLMRAMMEYDPNMSEKEAYELAKEYMDQYNRKIHQQQVQGQGTIEQSMQNR